MMIAIKRILLAACVLCAAFPTSAVSQTVTIQAESYTASYDTGGELIREEAGYLYGLDLPGEWVEYDLTIGSFGYYGASMKVRGELGVNYVLRLIFTPEGTAEADSCDVTFTGKGWG